MQKFLVDFTILWREQMGEVRANWQWYLLFSLIFPLLLIFGFTRLGNGLTDGLSLLYIISGSIIMSLTSDGLVSMAVKIGEMKNDNTMLYYLSLPINRFSFVLALIFSRFVVMVPGMIAPLIFGKLFYDFELELSFWLILLIPLISMSCSIFGLVVGILFDDQKVINLLSNALLMLVLLAAPIFIPYEALPLPFQWASFLIPLTYAGNALREALSGNIGTVFYINTFVLMIFTIFSLVFVTRFWNWRLH